MAILDANGVPILDLAPSSLEFVQGKHEQFLASDGDEQHLLTGAVVYVHNPRPVGREEPDVTVFHIGGETLDEALKSVVGAHDTVYAAPVGSPGVFSDPEWVASTDEDLARLLAEHYGCKVRSVSKAVKP